MQNSRTSYAHVHGDGGPQVNPDFAGGPSPLNQSDNVSGRWSLPEFALIDGPFNRTTNLTQPGSELRCGFCHCLPSTSSFHTTKGLLIQDSTFDYAGFDGGYFLPYYAGVPTNPRFIYPFQFTDTAAHL